MDIPRINSIQFKFDPIGYVYWASGLFLLYWEQLRPMLKYIAKIYFSFFFSNLSLSFYFCIKFLWNYYPFSCAFFELHRIKYSLTRYYNKFLPKVYMEILNQIFLFSFRPRYNWIFIVACVLLCRLIIFCKSRGGKYHFCIFCPF